jgi:hypothetical protein
MPRSQSRLSGEGDLTSALIGINDVQKAPSLDHSVERHRVGASVFLAFLRHSPRLRTRHGPLKIPRSARRLDLSEAQLSVILTFVGPQ